MNLGYNLSFAPTVSDTSHGKGPRTKRAKRRIEETFFRQAKIEGRWVKPKPKRRKRVRRQMDTVDTFDEKWAA